jgi:hypothetical protein
LKGNWVGCKPKLFERKVFQQTRYIGGSILEREADAFCATIDAVIGFGYGFFYIVNENILADAKLCGLCLRTVGVCDSSLW